LITPAYLYLLKYLCRIRQHFESAEMAAGLELSVTGILGFRAVHQVKHLHYINWEFLLKMYFLLDFLIILGYR
jgi:hypothetical protein